MIPIAEHDMINSRLFSFRMSCTEKRIVATFQIAMHTSITHTGIQVCIVGRKHNQEKTEEDNQEKYRK